MATLDNREVTRQLYPRRTQEDLIREAVERVTQKFEAEEPSPVTSLFLNKNVLVVGGRLMIQLIVVFETASDGNFHRGRVWIKGYGTENAAAQTDVEIDSLAWQQFAVVNQSPAMLLLEPTEEEIVVGVEAENVNGVGSGLEFMITETIDTLP